MTPILLAGEVLVREKGQSVPSVLRATLVQHSQAEVAAHLTGNRKTVDKIPRRLNTRGEG